MTTMRKSLALFLGLAALSAAPATASSFLGSVQGNVNQTHDLLGFSSIQDVTGLVLLGVFDSSQQDAGFSFPAGTRLGDLTGSFAFQGGTPLYFTVKASNVTGLYGFMSVGGNGFDTTQFTPGRGLSAIRVWGRPNPGIPEPAAAVVFSLGAVLVARRARRSR